jgi:hypothetical protein
MKYILILLLSTLTLQAPSQSKDSVAVRVYNKGRFYIKKYVVVIDNKPYVFSDVLKHKYSAYQNLPYIYPSNEIKATVVRKRFLRYDEWLQLLQMPIDHIGDEKIAKGKVTILISSKKKGKNLLLESAIVKE